MDTAIEEKQNKTDAEAPSRRSRSRSRSPSRERPGVEKKVDAAPNETPGVYFITVTGASENVQGWLELFKLRAAERDSIRYEVVSSTLGAAGS
jgi:hypothetical protein